MVTYMCTVREIAHSDTFHSLGRTFPFLDLRSEGLSNLATLSEPCFAQSDNPFALLDIIPSSLRSQKVKVLPVAWKVHPHLHSLSGHVNVTMEELLFFPPTVKLYSKEIHRFWHPASELHKIFNWYSNKKKSEKKNLYNWDWQLFTQSNFDHWFCKRFSSDPSLRQHVKN